MFQFYWIITSIVVFVCLTTPIVHAGQEGIQHKVSSAVEHLLNAADEMRCSPGHFSSSKFTDAAEEFRAAQMLFAEHLRNREKKLQRASKHIQDRHKRFAGKVHSQLGQVEPLVQEVFAKPDDAGDALSELSNLLHGFVKEKPAVIHSAMPYQQLELQTILPATTPVMIPAYRTGATAFKQSDLQAAPESPISQLIYQQAKSIATSAGKQNWDPVDLYQWVKNNIRTEWYWGSMKGAEETLRQGCGNDADQASLVLALFRAAGYPARYVRGVIEFFPDIEVARELFGVSDLAQIGELLRQAGVPHRPVMSGQQIVNYQVEHIWVEVQVPYANYRGVMADSEGKLWLPLDTSIKVAGFDETGKIDIFTMFGQHLTGMRDDYLAVEQQEVPLDYLRQQIGSFLSVESPATQYNSLLHHRSALPETMNILSTTPQFTEIVVTGEYSVLPDELIHKVSVNAVVPDTQEPLFEVTLPLRELTSRNISVVFDPETISDQETINQWGGLDNTPAYLVRLRPALVVDGERKAVAKTGLSAGQTFQLDLSVQSTSSSTDISNSVTTGYPLAVGVVAQEVSSDLVKSEGGGAVERMQRTVLAYIDRWNHDERELAELFNLRIARPLASVVTVGGALEVSELFGEPQELHWKGLFIDADLRAVAVVPAADGNDRQLPFLQLSALQGSALEHLVLEEHFGVESLSTVKLLNLVRMAGAPVLQVNSENAAEVLPALALAAAVESDILTAVEEGMTVTIPVSSVSYHSWYGAGYLKEDPLTGAAGYMLAGQIAGGSTALGQALWDTSLVATMTRPYQGEPNTDIAAAKTLLALTPLQTRLATAGVEQSAPLMVQVKDETGVAVAFSPVTFSVKKGGGWLVNDSAEPLQKVQQLTVQSDYSGIARARFVPGESVYQNPIVVTPPGDLHASIVGENIIDAQLATGSLAKLDVPIVVLGFAGDPNLSQVQTIGDGRTGDVLSYAGDVGMLLKDRFGNPVANYPVDFTLLPPLLNAGSACLQELVAAAKPAELVAMDDPCVKRLPVNGECSSSSNQFRQVSRSDGSVVAGMVLGGIAGADYAVNMSFVADSNSEEENTLHQYAADNGACGVAASPLEKLVLTYPRLTDAEGRNVDARPAGAAAHLNIKSYLVTESAVVQQNGETLACGLEVNPTCNRIIGSGEFTISYPKTVTGNGQELQRVARVAESSAMPYLYGLDTTLQEGLNQIPLAASGLYTRQNIINNCSSCGEPGEAEITVAPVAEIAEVWGVSLDLPEVLAASVNEQGVLQRDTAFEYSIRPAEYVAIMAQVLIYADGSLVESLLAPTSGTGQVVLPAGYFFAATKNYEIQVLLGNPGDVNAIYSKMIPIIPVVSEVNLHVDGLPESVEGNVGAFVLLNNDYDESDSDATVTQPDAATPTMIPEDDELKRAWVHINDADMVGGSWQVTADDPLKLRIYYESNGEFFEMNVNDPPQLITEVPLTVPVYLEGLAESDGLHANRLQLKYVSSSGQEIVDALPLTVVKFDVAVDGNRDRKILFDDIDDEEALFWVNNDRDIVEHKDEDSQDVEDDKEIGNDSFDNIISCKRDLEDFARIQVELGETAPVEQLMFTAEMVSDDHVNQPMVNLFKGLSMKQDYLGFDDNPEIADSQILIGNTASVGKEPVYIDSSLIKPGEISPLLYEGRNNGRGDLIFKVLHDGVPVLEKKVHLSLYDMSYFYDHFILEEGGENRPPVNEKVNPEGVEENASRKGLYQPATNEYVMFVHGWNMEQWEKRRWAETVFKRLWWRGYKGKVGLFDWPCRTLPSWDLPVNFDRSEFLAWHSGPAFRTLLTELNEAYTGQVRILAHSQGNVVAGEALKDIEQGIVHSYVASQAALSASFYEKELSLIQPALEAFTIETPEVYGNYPGGDLKPLLQQISLNVGSLFSYYNVQDYALTGDNAFSPRWEVNNKTKPDGTLSYGYQGNLEAYPPIAPDIGFYQSRLREVGDNVETYKYQLVFPEDRHDIYSFGAESRSRAAGAVKSLPVFIAEALDLNVRGSRDLFFAGYDEKHYSHSKEFRSNIIDEKHYWDSFVMDAQLNVR